LSRLEQAVSALVERLDNGDVGTWAPDVSSTSPTQPPPVHDPQPGTPSAAPVFLIRDVASEVGVRRQHHASGMSHDPDVIARGLVTIQEATALIVLSEILKLY
jgi:hypothetical protein